MSAAADNRKVTVSNLPSDIDGDTLMLILESSRYCPNGNGGLVEEVVISSTGTSATVTFEQEQDAQRVVGTQVNYNGTVLYIERLRPAAPPPRKKPANQLSGPSASSSVSPCSVKDDRGAPLDPTRCASASDISGDMYGNLPPVPPPPRMITKPPSVNENERGQVSGPISGSNSVSADPRYGNIHGAATSDYGNLGAYDDSVSGHYGNLTEISDVPAPLPPRAGRPQGTYGNLHEHPPSRPKSRVVDGATARPPKPEPMAAGDRPGDEAAGKAGRRPLPVPEGVEKCGTSGQADSDYAHYTLDQEVHAGDQQSNGDSSSGRTKDGGSTDVDGKPARKPRTKTGIFWQKFSSVFGGGSKDSTDNTGDAEKKADKKSPPHDDVKAAVKLKDKGPSTEMNSTNKDIPVGSYPEEKLRLLHKLLVNEEIKFACKVRLDVHSKLVTAIGNVKDVAASEKAVLQFLRSECHCLPVNIGSRNLNDLLLSDKGEKWLAEWATKNKFRVQVYSNKDSLNVVAANSEEAQRAKSRLEKDLSTTRVPLQGGHIEFVRSRMWMDFVRDKESQCLVRITVGPNESAVVIEGSTIAVKSVSDQVEAELRSKSKISKKVTLKAGAFRLLERFHKDQVQQVVKAAVQLGQNRGSVEVTFDDSKKCIQLAGTAEDIKIAEDSVNMFIKSDIGYDRLTISEPGITDDDFKSGSEGNMTVVCLEVDKKCVIEIQTATGNEYKCSSEQHGGSEPPDSSSQKTSMKTIIVEKGNISEFKKADVLVNLIPEITPDLSKAGAVANGFLVAAGQKLQDELKTKWPLQFGRDVTKTSAYGKVRAKKIYHAAVRRHRNDYSYNLMEDMIFKCVTMATEDGMSSIAFPTVGCGRLHYQPERVADTFQKVLRKNASTLTVYIIAFDEDTRAVFHDYLSSQTPAAVLTKESLKTSTTSDSTDSRIEFHINTLDKSAIPGIKRTLQDKVAELAADTETVHSPVIGKLNSAFEQEIKSLNTGCITIELDKTANTVKLRGNKKRLQQCKEALNVVLEKQRMLNESPIYLKTSGSVEDYLSFLANEGQVRYPPYWVAKDPSQAGDVPYRTLDSKSELYKEVEKVINSTWQPNKVGIGFDAVGLAHKKIEIQNIYVVENPALFQMYNTKRKVMCQKALAKQYPATKELQGENEIWTRSLVAGLKILPSTLVEEINEVFLLHGTKPVNVNAIMNDGLDERLGGEGLLFGKGSYFAETSTKSDQYADLYYVDPQKKDARTPPGTKLYMYMARVLLGNPFVCTVPQKFRRPPCDGAGCNKDVCDTHTTRHDSVIGTHSPKGPRLLFREFIVYENCASYLDFLVEYVRQ